MEEEEFSAEGLEHERDSPSRRPRISGSWNKSKLSIFGGKKPSKADEDEAVDEGAFDDDFVGADEGVEEVKFGAGGLSGGVFFDMVRLPLTLASSASS